ncbi:hypothetical protein VVR12_01785 [Rothia sp. LK2588]|uniref:hypothetical protein n=1 Tax=Rothia sp. LK2588 TaxID=3114369 RepID=UPI0034CECEEB
MSVKLIHPTSKAEIVTPDDQAGYFTDLGWEKAEEKEPKRASGSAKNEGSSSTSK